MHVKSFFFCYSDIEFAFVKNLDVIWRPLESLLSSVEIDSCGIYFSCINTYSEGGAFSTRNVLVKKSGV